MHAKNQDRSPSTFELKTNVFGRFYFRFARFYTRFNFRYADFNTDSADAFVLVRACVDCARVQLKTL